MRAPTDSIVAPLFPAGLEWCNVPVRVSLRLGEPDPARQADAGGVLGLLQAELDAHAALREGLASALRRARTEGDRRARAGFDASRSAHAVRDAVERLGISHLVVIDSEMLVWQEYENIGWPARYLFDGRARLFDYHHGEGGYEETELAIQELLGGARAARAAAPRGRARRCPRAAERRPGGRRPRPL